MIKKKKKLNKLKVRRCIIVLFIIILLITLLVCLHINSKNNRYKDLTILINNEFVELINKAIIDENENISFSKEDIQKLFDDTIYYNDAEKELITTHNKHIALMKIDEKYVQINDETIELKGRLQEIDKKVYLPISDLGIVYDIDIEYSKDSNRIIIESNIDKKVEATIQKKTKVKKSKNPFSASLEKLIIGDKVVVLENNGRYSKIRTSLGNIGYVKNKKLSDENIIRDTKKEETKELNAYRNYSNISGIYDNLEVDKNKLNVVLPTFFYMDKNNKVLDKTSSTTATYSIYKNWADNNSLVILPTFTNNESVSSNLLSYSQRSTVINSLRDLLINYKYIGVNIDFDTIDDVNSFYRFILELVPRFKEVGLKVAVTLNDNLDKSRLNGVVDYIIEK